MKALKVIVSVLLATCILVGCNNWEKAKRYKNFVQSYVYPSSFNVYKYDRFNPNEPNPNNKNAIVVSFSQGSKIPTGTPLYNQIAKENKDTDFNRMSLYGEGLIYNVSYKPIESISIISDTAFDSEHPAGTSLNDIFEIIFVDVNAIIESGYPVDLYGNSPKTILPLNQFNQEGRKSIELNFVLRAIKLPESTADHRFTVTYIHDNGLSAYGSSEPINIQGAN